MGKDKVINLASLIGGGYGDWWKFKGRYRHTIGGRASKKSCVTSLYFIYMLKKMPLANLLVVRRFFNTHRDSTFKQLKWAMERLNLSNEWHCTNQPLEMTNIITGQKILFKGLDDAQSLTSITVDHGYLCWVWCEEFYQITNEDDFNKLDMSIRGQLPDGYFKQITCTMNPWSENHFSKKRFFDIGIKHTDPDIFSIQTNYMCNEFLDDADRRLFEWMKVNNPKRYSIEGLGNWGRVEGLVYGNYKELDFNYLDLLQRHDNSGRPLYRKCYGLDFGFTNDPTALVCMLADEKNMEIYIYDEWYRYGATNEQIATAIRDRDLVGECIYADCQEVRTINELHLLGLPRVIPCKKGRDSIRGGIQKLQDYKIFVHPRCENTIIEFSNYAWDTDPDTGKQINKPIDEYNHICLTGDTQILTKDGYKTIKELIGLSQQVYSYNELTKQFELQYFHNCSMTKRNAEIYEIELENGTKIKATLNHPFYTQRGWVALKDLKKEDKLLTFL